MPFADPLKRREYSRIQSAKARARNRDLKIMMGIPDGRKGRKIPGAKCRIHEATILRMAGEGNPTGTIGNAVGLTAETVRRILIARGIRASRPCQKGALNPAWRGGRVTDKSGYILVHCPGHAGANSNGYVREHRLVAARMLKRDLLAGEVVDHVNGNKSDNRPQNLRVFASNAEHLKWTLDGRCPNWTPEGKERMRQGVIRGNKSRIRRNRIGATGEQ